MGGRTPISAGYGIRANSYSGVANRVALEACVQARNGGRDPAREGNEVILLAESQTSCCLPSMEGNRRNWVEFPIPMPKHGP